MAFFTGDLEGRNAHPELGKQIADNGKEYADKYWRYADMETCESLSMTESLSRGRRCVTDHDGWAQCRSVPSVARMGAR